MDERSNERSRCEARRLHVALSDRRGGTIIAGMLAATGLAIFLIPALFVLVERIAGKGKAKESAPGAAAAPATAPAPNPTGAGGGH